MRPVAFRLEMKVGGQAFDSATSGLPAAVHLQFTDVRTGEREDQP